MKELDDYLKARKALFELASIPDKGERLIDHLHSEWKYRQMDWGDYRIVDVRGSEYGHADNRLDLGGISFMFCALINCIYILDNAKEVR